MPITAGSFDPVPAFIWRPALKLINCEPVDVFVPFIERFIRFPFMARTGTETSVARQMQPAGQIIVRVRRDPQTEMIDPSMEIRHRSSRYGIICINPIPSNERDEIEFLVQYKIPSTLYLY